jgi:hypothetical protein
MSFHMILTCFPAGLRDPYSGQPTLNRQFVAVILLSFVLAIGFLLVILSCALWGNWLPILVGE